MKHNRISKGRDVREEYKTAELDYSIIAATLLKQLTKKGEKQNGVKIEKPVNQAL